MAAGEARNVYARHDYNQMAQAAMPVAADFSPDFIKPMKYLFLAGLGIFIAPRWRFDFSALGLMRRNWWAIARGGLMSLWQIGEMSLM